MGNDFGAELDSALNEHVAALRAAAGEARRRVREDGERLAALTGEEAIDPGILVPDEK
jgi:hypothetical protein